MTLCLRVEIAKELAQDQEEFRIPNPDSRAPNPEPHYDFLVVPFFGDADAVFVALVTRTDCAIFWPPDSV